MNQFDISSINTCCVASKSIDQANEEIFTDQLEILDFRSILILVHYQYGDFLPQDTGADQRKINQQ